MKAYVVTGFDQPAELMDVAVPRPADDEVLIRVHATSVNPVDKMVADGFFRAVQEYRLPAVFGRDLCGTVETVGRSVTRFRVGDIVWGFIKREHIGNGTFAEYVTCPADKFIALKPGPFPVVEAGVLGLSSVTALECLDSLELRPGQTVLINGATGGVGSFATQIAASRGLTVIATARPGPPTDYIRGLGAHQVIDWTSGDVAEAVLGVEPAGVDGLVDLLRWGATGLMGGDKDARQRAFGAFARRVVRPGGRLSSVTDGAGAQWLGDRTGINVHSTPTAAALGRINHLIEIGGLRAPIDSVFPFTQIAQAFHRQQRGALGKVAVTSP